MTAEYNKTMCTAKCGRLSVWHNIVVVVVVLFIMESLQMLSLSYSL